MQRTIGILFPRHTEPTLSCKTTITMRSLLARVWAACSAAAQLLQRGKRVAILERLPHCGGRFTAKTFHGVQVSTGAVHMIPFGSSGVLARTLNRLRVPHHFFDADVFASFHTRGKQIRSKGLLGTFKVFGPRQFFWFLRAGYLMFFRPLPDEERTLPFDQWLARHINVRRNPELVAFFERISRFAFSLELSPGQHGRSDPHHEEYVPLRRARHRRWRLRRVDRRIAAPRH